MELYSIQKIHIFNVVGLFRVGRILFRCGKYMAEACGLHHWDNSHIKNMVIIAICALKRRIYLVRSGSTAVATFQTKQTANAFHFSKLATDPAFEGRGIGTFCLETIEQMAVKEACPKVCMEVYDQSRHAIQFYEKRGYRVYGSTNTLKYTQLKMEKHLEN